jgi:signal transduction histidine kinase
MDSLFEPFLQTQTGRQSLEGTGLGLPIARQFVQLMGGDIRVSSHLGKGSIFHFEIEVDLAQEPKIVTTPNKSLGDWFRIWTTGISHPSC